MGRKHPPALDGSLVETQIVRHRKAWLVADVINRSDLHWRFVSVSRSRSYIAAPIVVGDDVVALLHADRFQQWRSVDVRDRDMLWLFCEGLSNLCSRAAITEHLGSLRDELDRLVVSLSAGSGDVWASSTARGSYVSPNRPDDASHLQRERTVGRALTRRELEVLRLVSQGLTNAQIARKLFIGEGTVKSHVKAILRKLHASHRAEAVSMWLRETNRAQGKAG
jgi:DNA-binding CsgD family transcriptional regulator